MRRADRLFLIIHALRGRRMALPARRLAETLGVSLRTVYRDVADLQLSGVPIEGEAGVGYLLRKGSDIPPLMFNADELEALVVGTRFVRSFGGARLAQSAQAALLKIEAVLPPELRARASIAGLLLPEAVAYSGLAGLPPQAGVVGLFAGLLCYGLIGRSRHAIVSATSSSAAVLAAATLALAADDLA